MTILSNQVGTYMIWPDLNDTKQTYELGLFKRKIGILN